MSRKIIFEVDKLKQASIDLISDLDDYDLLRAHFLLEENFHSELLKEEMFLDEDLKIQENSIIFEENLKSYWKYLEASGNAKSTVKNYRREAERLLDYLNDRDTNIKYLDFDTISIYLSDSKKQRNLSQNPYSKLVVIIRSFLSFLHRREIIPKDPTSEIKVPKKVNKEREYLSESDIKKVEKYFDNRKEKYRGENSRNRIIFYLGIYCGLRKAEIIKLNWENLDFNECRIKIIESKGGKDRVVYFSQKLMETLSGYRKILSIYGGAVVRGNFGKGITSTSLHNTIQRMYRESGIYRDGLCVHSLRHTYAENLRKNKVDLHTIKALLGHNSLDTTNRYLHVSKEDLKEAALD